MSHATIKNDRIKTSPNKPSITNKLMTQCRYERVFCRFQQFSVLYGAYTYSAEFNSGLSDIPRAQKQSIRLPTGIDGTTPWKRWRNITTDVDDGYVNWPSIHETNKRFSIVVWPKEGSSKALAPIPRGVYGSYRTLGRHYRWIWFRMNRTVISRVILFFRAALLYWRFLSYWAGMRMAMYIAVCLHRANRIRSRLQRIEYVFAFVMM